MTLQVEFFAVLPSTGVLVPLPDTKGWDLSPVRGGTGALKLSYPANGQNFATLVAHVDDDRDLEVAVWVAGVPRPDLGGILQESSGDQVDPEAVWTFSGRDLSILLDEAIVAPVLVDGKLVGPRFSAATPGSIIDTVLVQAQGRGALLDITTPSWSPTADSNGQAWTSLVTIEVTPGVTVLGLLLELADLGVVEWQMYGRELRLFQPGTLGVDRTLTTPPVVLYPGRDQLDAPVKHTVSASGTTLYLAGKDGAYRDVTDPTALARRGRRIERYDSQGDIDDDGMLNVAAQARLAQIAPGTRELSHGIAVDGGGALPLIDFDIWDWVFDGTNPDSELRRYQVAQWNLSAGEDGEVTAGVVLNDLIDLQQVLLQRRLDSLASGATIVGAPSPEPEQDDGLSPKAPTGLNASTSAYVDETGVTFARITAGWAQVLLNEGGPLTDKGRAAQLILDRLESGLPIEEDWTWAGAPSLVGTWNDPLLADYDASGSSDPEAFLASYIASVSTTDTAADDIAGYRVQFRYQGPDITESAYSTVGDVDASRLSLSWTGVAPAQNVQFQVLAYDKFGNFSVPSAPFTVVSGIDTTGPPVLSAPVVTSFLGLLAIEWNGLGALGEAMPTDFRRARIHVSTTSGFTANSSNYIDDLRGPGVYPFRPDDVLGNPPYGTTFYVKLVPEDNVGNLSAASAQGSAVLLEIEGNDVASLSISRLTAGILTAIMTVAGIIRTSLTGARVELDTNGLRCISSTGAVLFEFSIPSSLLTVAGRILAGAGIGLGATIDINPTTASIDSYPNATAARINQRAFNTSAPDGSGTVAAFVRQFLNTAGQTAGPVMVEWTQGIWHTFRNTSGQYFGGFVKLQENAGFFGYQSAGGGTDAYVSVGVGGDVVFSPDLPNGEIRGTKPFGTQGAGFNFLAQNGQDQGYRMAAISGVLRFVENAGNVALSDGLGGTKSFVIDHPTDDARWLVHGCTEGPAAGVEYHGDVEVTGHEAWVELPSYFEHLVRPDGRHVQLTVQINEEPADVPGVDPEPPALGPTKPDQPGALSPGAPGLPAVPEWATIPTVAASTPRDGRFRIISSAESCRVTWRVYGVRSDVPVLEVEPLRAAVTAHGDGPYRYLTPTKGST